jgi:hypothetical protein
MLHWAEGAKDRNQIRFTNSDPCVVVSRTRIVQSIFGSIQEYAGFEREDWLE